MEKRSLLIGAGACGLMAAKELAGKFDITILEGNSRIGGRINTISIENDTIESGAEFIHGHMPLTFKILKEAGIDTVKLKGKFYQKKNGQFIEQEDMVEGWNELLRNMASLKEDMPMLRFLETFYAGAEYASFREWITGYTEGFDIADPSIASTKQLYAEWSADENVNFRIPLGYISLINQLKKQFTGKLFTNKKVKEVLWNKNNVKLITAGKETFHANKVLITVPISILQQRSGASSITFTPMIDEYIKASENIGYGNVIKVVIRFKNAFWQKNGLFFFNDEGPFGTWWSQAPLHIPIITGWLGGPNTINLRGETKDSILQIALQSLAATFNQDVMELRKDIIYSEIDNWEQNEFSLGAYSFNTIHSQKAKALLNTPVLDTVFFAGEALYVGNHHGTVEAALVSGKNVAGLIKKS